MTDANIIILLLIICIIIIRRCATDCACGGSSEISEMVSAYNKLYKLLGPNRPIAEDCISYDSNYYDSEFMNPIVSLFIRSKIIIINIML